MEIKDYSEDLRVLKIKEDDGGCAQKKQDQTGQEKQVKRGMNQHKSEVSPAVPERSQLGLPHSRIIINGNLFYLQIVLERLNEHLRIKFRVFSSQVKLLESLFSHGPHAGLGIIDSRPEKKPQKIRQYRV